MSLRVMAYVRDAMAWARAGRVCSDAAGAWGLVDVDGLSVEEAAAQMKLPVGRVRRLVGLHRDALELKALKQDSIPVARLRAFFDAELVRQPGLTRAEVARRLQISQSDLDRRIGLSAARNSALAERRRVSGSVWRAGRSTAAP